MPEIITPDTTSSCPLCGGLDWDVISDVPETFVYLLGGWAMTRFAKAECRNVLCRHIVECDGIEEGLLRASDKLAFSHEVLNDWDHQTLRGVRWWTFLLTLLERYQGLTWQEKELRLQRDYRIFQQATFDYIRLQDIHEDEMCACGGTHVVGKLFSASK